MFTRPPHLSDADVVEALAAGWGRAASSIEYAPVGFGSHHWRVTAGRERWFVTADDLRAKRRSRSEPLDQPRRRLTAALTTARSMCDAGLAFVIAPELTTAGQVTMSVGEVFEVAVYRHVEGQTHAYGPYATSAERLAVLERLAALHSAPSSCRRQALMDDLTLANCDGLTTALGALSTPWQFGPFAEPARSLLKAHASDVERALDRYDDLAASRRDRPERYVLTHGEPHPGNTITTDAGVMLIDWDTALIAPPERDLWTLVDEDPAVGDAYTELTGTAVDPGAIELYRLGWDLAEIAIYITQFRRVHDDTEDSRTAWAGLQQYLDPARWQPTR